MVLRVVSLLLLSAALSSCSYAYEILAVVRGGRLVFVVNTASGAGPSCLRQIEVIAERPTRAQPEPGDDTTRVGYGAFWSESVSHRDACKNRFPIAYGVTLSGEHERDKGPVKAKPVVPETVYEVSSTTGATGYGSGRFIIHANGRVENLPRDSQTVETNTAEHAD
jgi:hypothetical protein